MACSHFRHFRDYCRQLFMTVQFASSHPRNGRLCWTDSKHNSKSWQGSEHYQILPSQTVLIPLRLFFNIKNFEKIPISKFIQISDSFLTFLSLYQPKSWPYCSINVWPKRMKTFAKNLSHFTLPSLKNSYKRLSMNWSFGSWWKTTMPGNRFICAMLCWHWTVRLLQKTVSQWRELSHRSK